MMTPRNAFKIVYNGAKNAMTPRILRYGSAGGYYYELSASKDESLYGVTVLLRDTLERKHDKYRAFYTLEDAKEYIEELRKETMINLDNLKTQGFHIKHIEREQWDKWADAIQKVTGLTWKSGRDLKERFFPECDVGFDPDDNGLSIRWPWAYIEAVPFHYATLEDFVRAIGLL